MFRLTEAFAKFRFPRAPLARPERLPVEVPPHLWGPVPGLGQHHNRVVWGQNGFSTVNVDYAH